MDMKACVFVKKILLGNDSAYLTVAVADDSSSVCSKSDTIKTHFTHL